jgi:hypothetical protein
MMDQLIVFSALGSSGAALLGALGWLIYRSCLGIALIIDAKGRREARRSAVRLAERRARATLTGTQGDRPSRPSETLR